jgi:hypothetical protein
MEEHTKYFLCFWGGMLFMVHTLVFAFMLSAVHHNRKDIQKMKESIEFIRQRLENNK